MRTFRTLTLALIFLCSMGMQAQTADEIIDTYFENTGGIENWSKLEGILGVGKGIQQGQEFPGQMIQLKNGNQKQSYTVQGKEFHQGVFDGETLWSTNFMTMKAEKSSAEETENFKLEANDFPNSFLNWKDKGYTVELLGKEDMDGTDTFKIKLIKEPVQLMALNKMIFLFTISIPKILCRLPWKPLLNRVPQKVKHLGL